MYVTLRLLVDDAEVEGLAIEHGFAAWIEAGENRILLDTGAGQALIPNARSLGVDLARATALVLSHGHYDHTGGLPGFLAANSTASLFFAAGVERERFNLNHEPPRSIGMSPAVNALVSALPPDRRHEIASPWRLARGIGLSGPIPRRNLFEDTGGRFFLDADGRTADPLEDDQALWFETEGGLVIVLGCCHAGIANTVECVRAASGIDRVRGIVGGLHLGKATGERLRWTEAFLRELNLEFLIPCHCTGCCATAALMDAVRPALSRPGHAGMLVPLGVLRS